MLRGSKVMYTIVANMQHRVNASLKDCLVGVSGFKRFRCPSHDSRRRSVTMLQVSHFVTSYSCWFVMTRGYFIPRAYRSCRRWKSVYAVVYGLSRCPQFAVIQKDTFSKHSKVAYLL